MVIAAKIDVLLAQWRQMCQIAQSRMLLLCFMIIDASLQVGRPQRASDVKSHVFGTALQQSARL
jgi:hypothetical protein